MTNLGGLHDRESAALGITGTWAVDTIALADNPSPPAYDPAYAWLCRANWSYGSTGTLPVPDWYGEYVVRLAEFVRGSTGCRRWVIGNEPNLPREWPDGQPIFPWQYADVYKAARRHIHAIPGHERDEVLIAGTGPWNADLKYEGNPSGDWIQYFKDVITACGNEIDGFAIHAYTHKYDVSLVTSSARMDAPFLHRRYEFRTYRDYMEAIPALLWSLPVYITEANGDGPWQAVGLMPAMLGEIDYWNKNSNHQICAVVFYRYPKYDEFAIEGKADVIAEYTDAIGRGYQSPQITGANQMTTTVHIPYVPNESPTITAPALPREIGESFRQRTQNAIQFATPPAGQTYFALIKAEYVPDGARRFGPDHHILVEVLDANGKRKQGQIVSFVTDREIIGKPVDKQGGPYGVDYDLYAPGYGYGVYVGETRSRSDFAGGMGMGTIEQPDWAHHVDFYLVFQETIAEAQAEQPAPPSQPVPPPAVPFLVHPIAEPALRVISQRFGENPQDYARFGLAGHNGVDFAVPMDTQIRAVDDGEIIESANDEDGYGDYMKIRHTWGESLYAHLWVRRMEGVAVRAGEEIGRSGNTGNSTGPHLHFGMRVFPYQRGYPFDGYIDPLPYLEGKPIARPTDLRDAIRIAAQEFGIDPNLLLSQAWAESSFRPGIDGGGLLQVSDAVWSDYADKIGAVGRTNALDNARVAAAFMQWLIARYSNIDTALAAYNFGPRRVDDGEELPWETIIYQAKVIHGRDLLKAVGR